MQYSPAKDHDDLHSFGDPVLASRELGFTAAFTLEDTLRVLLGTR